MKTIVLFEIDTMQLNTQWVNVGAGIWAVSIDGTYDFVGDDDLLDGFTAQPNLLPIDSVFVSLIRQNKVATLAEVTTTDESWYYDATDSILYVKLPNGDDPLMHTIFIGVVDGFSYGARQPAGSQTLYTGHVQNIPDIGIRRDPLFFGRLSYPTVTVDMINADGYFNTYAEDNFIYGTPARVKLGFEGEDISAFRTLYTGFIENFTVSERGASFTVTDRRKQFSRRAGNFIRPDQNALLCIRELLDQEYGIKYTANNYDLAIWAAAEALAPNVALFYTEEQEVTVISIIEDICRSLLGIFDITDAGLLTFRYISATGASIDTVPREDQLTELDVSYDPSEVVSSVRVGYMKDWGDNSYLYYTDKSREATIYSRYKTYNERTFDTLLEHEADAIALAERIMDYFEDVRGLTTREVPFDYYGLNVGDIITMQLDRANATMLGSKTCEVLGRTYRLALPTIVLDVRVV